tara:strand:+ start:57 stop:236 length:180 start_codon:yes stop_codon:yes gene_type:complete
MSVFLENQQALVSSVIPIKQHLPNPPRGGNTKLSRTQVVSKNQVLVLLPDNNEIIYIFI